MEWSYLIIIGIIVAGVVLVFPLAVGVCVALGALMIGLDHFTARCAGFRHVRRWFQRRRYQPGRIVSRFLVPDVRREIQVVDASALDAGLITVRTRTWNILYARTGRLPKPDFGEVRTVAFKDLWAWSGQPWGGPVAEADR